MKDRNVQFPHRYQMVPVAGQESVYDFVPVPGNITEPGTPINKATLLKDATAALYGLTGEDATVDGAFEAVSGALKYGEYSQMGGGAGTTETASILAFTTVDKDEFGAINIATHPTRLTIPPNVSRVRFYGTLRVTASTFSALNTVTLFRNGATTSCIILIAGFGSYTFYSEPFEVSANDYFELYFTRGGSAGAVVAGTIFGMEVLA